MLQTSLAGIDILPVNYDAIYEGENGFQFNLPRTVLESFFGGKAFGRQVEYTPEERSAIEKDIQLIWDAIVQTNPEQEPQRKIVVTAGAPGAGKTRLLEGWLKAYDGYAYTDPDAVCLKQMKHTYQADCAQGMSQTDAYAKWRPASNAINQWILANLLKAGYNIAFGTTSTSEHTARFFEFVKSHGYNITVLHITASDETRWKSIQDRDKEFVQTTEKDIREKGGMIFERISDTFFAQANEVYFYAREYDRAPVLVGSWKQGGQLKEASLAKAYGLSGMAYVKAAHGKNWPN